MLDRRKIRDHRGHHPWQTIACFPQWKVELTYDLPPNTLGLTLHEEQRILIRRGLTVASRRSTLCHETGHVLRGAFSDAVRLYEEALVERQAARLLMPSVTRIGHAMAWNRGDYTATASDLWVDERLFNSRLSTLAPSERSHLEDQLASIVL